MRMSANLRPFRCNSDPPLSIWFRFMSFKLDCDLRLTDALKISTKTFQKATVSSGRAGLRKVFDSTAGLASGVFVFAVARI